MADEERQDSEPQEQEKASAPEETNGTPADETPAEEPAPEELPAEDGPAEESPVDEEEQVEDEAAAEEAAPSSTPETPAAESTEAPKAKDQPPGAELDPIAIEPERELSAEERAKAEAEAEERARLEAEAADDEAEEPLARSGPAVQLDTDARIQATGKRKSSVARVVLRPGDGAFEVNARRLEEYFPRHQHQSLARQPLVTAGYEGTVDVRVRVHGGGVSGQAGAVRHGVARALTEIDPDLRGELKRRGLLTRDARRKERRKAGLKKARKRPQFSKR
jgi:small subunit ribosomal protein S9